MNLNNDNNPEFLNNYIVHLKIIKSLSDRSINEYYFDIRMFLKYTFAIKNNINFNELNDIDISSMNESVLKTITVSDIYNFIFYISDERDNHERARYRKTSAIRSFFKYLCNQTDLIDNDPSINLDIPSPKRTLPKFLSLNESLKLLSTADLSDSRRDYCIITLFLNCGMRLSELIGINLADIDFDECRVRILGKGNKERIVHLNSACISSINRYLEIRKNIETMDPALFLSNQKKRISKRRVQQIVENTLKSAGLDQKGITTHKLRHTAATLMYQYGDADMLILKEILGHASISTTEIYTHLSDDIVKNTMESNPLANEKSKYGGIDDERKNE